MNKYEIMFIIRPNLEDDARAALLENIKNLLTSNNGTVDNVNEWGLREFAYEIKDFTKGYYVIVDTTTNASDIQELDRLSRINADILRHMIIRK